MAHRPLPFRDPWPGLAGLFLFTAACGAYAAAAPATDAEPDWLPLILGLSGGLALFLAGLQMLSEGMKKAAGSAMRDLIARLTTNRFMAVVTGLLNSSTVTTLLVVGFISGGMMTLAQSVGVIMGANIGSTVTAQLLAFNLSEYSLGAVAIGFFMRFAAKRDRIRYYGMMIMGFGLLFYGMGLMGSSMHPLRTYPPFLELLQGLKDPFAGILAGTVFTVVVQSSAATVGIAIAMATEGLLGLPAGIALALGANIGTAVTTGAMGFLSSQSAEASRAAVVHVLFNVLGVLIWLPLIGMLAELAVWISPSSPELQSTARAAAEVPRQIANANTLFNTINTFLFIGFSGLFARAAMRLVPERKPAEGMLVAPRYLDDSALETPPAALQQARLEVGRVGGMVAEMLREIEPALCEGETDRFEEIARRGDQVDVLEGEILRYLGRIRREDLGEREFEELQQLLLAVDNFESLAEVIRTDLYGLMRRNEGLPGEMSQETEALLTELYRAVAESVRQAAEAIRNSDQQVAEEVTLCKEHIRELSTRVLERKALRLVREDEDHVARVRWEMAFVDQMRRIYTLAKRIAKQVLPPDLAEKD